MIVVSDSTPLITLMKTNKLSALHKLFGEVLIPEAVFSEVTTNETFHDEAELIKNSVFIRIVKVRNNNQVLFLQRATGLDLGESEAIICADEMNADLLLMDELAGRKVAQNMRIPITGSIGVFIRAVQEGIITPTEAENAFAFIRQSNRHIDEKILKKALEIIHGISE